LNAANKYREAYRNEITIYEIAERYLHDVPQDHFDPKKLSPVTKWKAERDKLAASRNRLSQDYY